MTNHVYYVRRVSGKGIDAVYNLYVDDHLTKSSIFISEVVEILSQGDEGKSKRKSLFSRIFRRLRHGN